MACEKRKLFKFLLSQPSAIFGLSSLQASFSGALCWPGGKRKESLQLLLWNLNICIEKVDAKCWLAEVTWVMTSVPLARVFQSLFTSSLISTSHWLAEIWQLSRWRATGKLEVEFKFQRQLQALLPFPAPPSEHPGDLAHRLWLVNEWSHYFWLSSADSKVLTTSHLRSKEIINHTY